MESISVNLAKELFGHNFIGPEELNEMADTLNILQPSKLEVKVPDIPYERSVLENLSSSHLLFLGMPFDNRGHKLTLVSLRNHFGYDPLVNEPCFYNQDWYLHEQFANTCTIEYKWYLMRRELINSTRGKTSELQQEVDLHTLPSALLCAYAFFAFYFHSKEYLWQHDFVWCKDLDNNGDRIYIGRYFDVRGLSKNGFSIHRFLSINNSYGCIDLY